MSKSRSPEGEVVHEVLSRHRHLAVRYRKGQSIPQDVADKLAQSRKQYFERRQRVPTTQYDDALPISRHREEIKKAIIEHQVVILCGDTGSGKSTQLPKICLDAGRGVAGLIAHTQPRRIAARSIAARISEEMGAAAANVIGYRTRFDERVHANNYVRLVTDGILLSELTQSRFLAEYDTIIIDEAHERSLNIDFLLGYLKRLLPKRPDLKLIITSATIDPQRFSRHFNNAPIIMVEGRTYPVQLQYRPDVDGEEEQHYVNVISEATRKRDGDVLVFLAGEAQIREMERLIQRDPRIKAEVVPLYGRLGPNEQQRVFANDRGNLRVVLATNVAETSITVPGIRYVVDSGLARVQRFSNTHQVKRLPIEAIARANCDQRAGRCGRVADGVCYRLYSQEDYEARPQFLEPEVLRTSLSQVVLSMSHLKLGQPERFPFIDAPEGAALREARKLLVELGALESNALTNIGTQLARLPIDPRVGRVLLESRTLKCLHEGLILTAFLSAQDPRIITSDNREKARQRHIELIDAEKASEVWEVILIWRRLMRERKEMGRRAFQRFCEQHFIAPRRFQEWGDIYRQLRDAIKAKPTELNEGDHVEALHQSLLSGFLGNIALQYDGREYRGTRNKSIVIAPGRRAAHKWIVAAELVHTTRLYARMTAPIKPEWIIAEGGPQILRSYSNSHWSKRRGVVMADEKCSYQGLLIRSGKKVPYGPINASESRQVFIQEAIIAEQLSGSLTFMRHNRAFLAEFEDWESRTRRSDVRIDDVILFNYFDARLPEDCWSESRLGRWLKTQPSDALCFKEEDFVVDVDEELIERAFPSATQIGANRADIDYEFQPGSASDGASIEVDIGQLNQVDAAEIDWAIPGLVHERITALMRSLPKAKRKLFVPVNQTAQRFLDGLDDQPALLPALCAYLNKKRRHAAVVEGDFRLDQVEAHLLPLIRIVDEKGVELDCGRNLDALKQKWHSEASQHYHSEDAQMPSGPVDVHDFHVPESVEWQRGGKKLVGYPALTTRDGVVEIRVFDSIDIAQREHCQGLSALIRANVSGFQQVVKQYKKELDAIALNYASISTYRELEHSLKEQVIEKVFLTNKPLPRDADAFDRWVGDGIKYLATEVRFVVKALSQVMKLYLSNSQAIDAFNRKGREDVTVNMRAHLNSLVYDGFISQTPLNRLIELPRYLKALALRIERAESDYAKDCAKMAKIRPWLESGDNADTEDYRFALEEYRVLTYAPELGTKIKVSEKILSQLRDTAIQR